MLAREMIGTSLRWLLLITLLMGFLWTANVAAYNWWAAGGPPVPNPELYARRALIFSVVSGVLLLGACATAWTLLVKRRPSR
jgi:hypothetical protein